MTALNNNKETSINPMIIMDKAIDMSTRLSGSQFPVSIFSCQDSENHQGGTRMPQFSYRLYISSHTHCIGCWYRQHALGPDETRLA